MRGVILTLMVLNALLLPVGCVPLAVLTGPVNPMTVSFVTDIHVTNATGRAFAVTPVGTIGQDGQRSRLPMFHWRYPAVRSDRAGGFVVRPGETVELLYDWDDINLSELVVDSPDGSSRQLVVDRQPTTRRYRRPDVNRFTIADVDALEPVPPDVAAAAARAREPERLWLFSIPLILPWVTFWPMLRAYRRRERRTGAGPEAAR